MLLVGAGLVLRSTTALMSIPPGFTPTGVAVLKVYGTGLERGDAVAHQFFDQALAAVDEVPGVNVAALTTQLPLSGDSEEFGVSLAGLASADPVTSAYRYAVTSDYFAVMGIRVLQGRALDPQDVPGSPPVVVISESLATRIAPDGSALGEQIHVGPIGEVPYTVVGVVANVKQTTLDTPRTDAVYITPSQWHSADRVRWIVVRSDQDPTALVPAIRQAVWSVDQNQPIVAAQALEMIVSRSDAQRSFVLLVMSSFAVLALILAGVGLYGVLTASVSERMREIGVRAALGASRENIVALIVGQGLTLTVAGVLVGMAGAATGGGLLRPMLYGVSRLDVTTYAVVALTLMAVGAIACWIPAVRAARVDPLTTLKAN
jgi:predicted permease